jgi:hypothetical protein
VATGAWGSLGERLQEASGDALRQLDLLIEGMRQWRTEHADAIVDLSRALAMLREEMTEEPRPDALDRLRIGAHQQQSFWALEEPLGQDAGKLSARCEGFSLQAGRHLHENDRRARGLVPLLPAAASGARPALEERERRRRGHLEAQAPSGGSEGLRWR